MRLPPIDIIIPFHGRADLFSLLFTSIRRVQGELKELDCAIIAVNDSPGDQSVRENLVREANGLDGMLECTVLENEVNQGFVRSANRALRETIRRGHDALLLNSDTVLFPGAVSEIRRVAYLDSTIGFVSPRSNNASLCSLPHQHEYNSLPPDESFAIYDVLARRLPDHHYVPTGVGFCLYIKLPVLERVSLNESVSLTRHTPQVITKRTI
jgi:GT2 family glycosyltransferase